MKKTILSLMFLIASNSYASGVCMVTAETYTDTPDNFGRILIDCDAKNPDTSSIKTAGETPTYVELSTALNLLVGKGYKITSQSGGAGYPLFTLQK